MYEHKLGEKKNLHTQDAQYIVLHKHMYATNSMQTTWPFSGGGGGDFLIVYNYSLHKANSWQNKGLMQNHSCMNDLIWYMLTKVDVLALDKPW